eukprot:356798-Chlamydomonas_euryale.AAC.1
MLRPFLASRVECPYVAPLPGVSGSVSPMLRPFPASRCIPHVAPLPGVSGRVSPCCAPSRRLEYRVAMFRRFPSSRVERPHVAPLPGVSGRASPCCAPPRRPPCKGATDGDPKSAPS